MISYLFAEVIGSQRPEDDTLQGNNILFPCWYRFKGWMSQALWISTSLAWNGFGTQTQVPDGI